MIATMQLRHPANAFRHRGFTMVELMVGITLGLMVLAVATTVFVNVSNNRHDTTRVARQIENGRYAMSLLADDLANAGYFGEFDPRLVGAPVVKPDPCSVNVADMKANVMMHVQGYGPAAAKPACLADVKANTAAIVVRRTATCIAGAANCDAVANGDVYLQSTLCNAELAAPAIANHYAVAAAPGGPFPHNLRDCATGAALRRYEMHLYFVANNNAAGDGIPTLKRAELSAGAFTIVPLVEGIENLQVEYGLDTDGNSTPNAYTADPGTFNGCGADPCYVANFVNAVTARIHLLARTTEMTAGGNDIKTFSLGNDEAGNPITVGPYNDKYKRHVYTQVVRMNNPAGRRE
jgi:type IV pilus assembly protein PilW